MFFLCKQLVFFFFSKAERCYKNTAMFFSQICVCCIGTVLLITMKNNFNMFPCVRKKNKNLLKHAIDQSLNSISNLPKVEACARIGGSWSPAPLVSVSNNYFISPPQSFKIHFSKMRLSIAPGLNLVGELRFYETHCS